LAVSPSSYPAILPGIEKKNISDATPFFVHEFSRICTNWRLVRPVSPFKTAACLVMRKVFQDCRCDYNRMVVFEMKLADQQERILAVSLLAIQLSSQELKKEHHFMPCGARYSFSSG